MNAVFKKIRILALAGLFALAMPSAALGQLDTNPEFPADVVCNDSSVTTTEQAGETAQVCRTDITCLKDEFGNITGETTTNTNCSTFSRNRGCFAPETSILMADGSEKKIIELVAGDMVWNPIKKAPAAVGKMVGGPEKQALFEIGYGDYSVKVTKDHPMIVYSIALNASLSSKSVDAESFIVKRADQISLNDYILGADGEYHRVSVLMELPVSEGQLVFNFSLDVDSSNPADHAVVADGVVTGDLDAQLGLGQKESI